MINSMREIVAIWLRTLGTVASMIACGVSSGSFFCCSSFAAARVFRAACFFGAGLIIAFAASYGFTKAGFLGGVTSLMSSVMKAAARVGLP